MSAIVCDYFLFPNVQEFLTFDELLAMQLIDRRFYKFIQNGAACHGYWQNLCINFAKKYGLYHHCNYLDGQAAKQHMIGELLPLRHKWKLMEENKKSENFKVRTMCRFRPGNSCTGKVLLPFHQFLKLRRQKQAKDAESGVEEGEGRTADDAISKFGRNAPDEFMDPILGTTMKEPVLLTGPGASERIVDRSVAVQCMLHGGDPFTGVRLTSDMVVAQPDLAARIREWAATNVDYDPSVDMADLKSLVDEGNEVNPALLEALMEVQQLQAVGNKVFAQSRLNSLGNAATDGFHEEVVVNNLADPADLLSDGPETQEDAHEGATSTDAAASDASSSTAAVEGTVAPNPADAIRDRKNARATDTTKIVDVNTTNAFVSMHIPGQGVKSFHYSKVFHEKGWSHVPTNTAATAATAEGAQADTSAGGAISGSSFVQMYKQPKRQNHNEQPFVYSNSAKESCLSVMNGYNACVLAYGQTGSGKTFSLFGHPASIEQLYNKHVAAGTVVAAQAAVVGTANTQQEVKTDAAPAAEEAPFEARSVRLDDNAGMVVRCFLELLEARAQLMQQQSMHVTITAQFVEIYNENVTDLLTGKSIQIRRDTGAPVGATSTPVETLQDVLWMLHTGQQRKRFASTAMNDHSSRSHTAVILTINQAKSVPVTSAAGEKSSESAAASCAASSTPAEAPRTETVHCSSSLYLVDLAGSERVKKSKATGQQLGEAVGINSSLLVLGKVISALVDGKAHVPYLESKLTTLLRQAFGGNCRTSVMVHCRPDEAHAEETLQSMRFGERCSMILNTTKLAATSKEATLATIDAALDRMNKQLLSLKNNGKQHLDAFGKISASLGVLQLKRNEIESM